MGAVTERNTKQKAAILRIARASREHPTADAIYAQVRKELPRISLGTVYRNLQRLVAEGKLGLTPVEDRVARFDPTVAAHDHFVCQHCRRIYDVDRGHGPAVDFDRFERAGFHVSSHTLSVYGSCPDCQSMGRPGVPA